MRHIFNLSRVKKLMDQTPKAQRLQRLMNDDEYETLTAEEARDLILTLRRETEKTCQTIIDNVPFKIEI